mmetsp:Transcript_6831/g.9944  ORF Transcript_6831/g.9944 Transcript_6831/m.9944 type:complete len:205 (-) Transcript_6831:160-774(-)
MLRLLWLWTMHTNSIIHAHISIKINFSRRAVVATARVTGAAKEMQHRGEKHGQCSCLVFVVLLFLSLFFSQSMLKLSSGTSWRMHRTKGYNVVVVRRIIVIVAAGSTSRRRGVAFAVIVIPPRTLGTCNRRVRSRVIVVGSCSYDALIIGRCSAIIAHRGSIRRTCTTLGGWTWGWYARCHWRQVFKKNQSTEQFETTFTMSLQ